MRASPNPIAALTEHGGRLDRAAALYPDAPRPWLDLSTGINPVAWAPSEPVAVDLAPLPSPAALAELEATAAAAFGTTPDRTVAVPGSEIGLRLLGRLDLPRPWRFVAPGYRTHADALAGARAVAFEGLGNDPGNEGTLLLANPNNPDGRLLAPDALSTLRGDGWMIVDEAFADAIDGASIVPALPANGQERTIVLRSFGKIFGLAGLRLGFVVAPPAIVARLRAMLGAWPISAHAIAYGTAAYRDTAWLAATRTRLTADAAALDGLLMHHGLSPRGACPLFRLVEADARVFDRLARVGVLTRPFDDAPTWLRIGLPGGAAALARLDAALVHG